MYSQILRFIKSPTSKNWFINEPSAKPQAMQSRVVAEMRQNVEWAAQMMAGVCNRLQKRNDELASHPIII
jgi:hypothetical protein